jgi:hypothetical protein
VYATAANGLEVRIPKDKYPQWKKRQDELRAGKTESDPETVRQLRSLMEKK